MFKDYFKWLIEEIKSINVAGGVMLSFIIGVQLAFYLSSPITLLSTITLIATLVGSACTVYMMSAIGFIYINWSAGHYASVLDQLVFILLIDLPLILTWRNWGDRVKNGVKFLTNRGWFATFATMAILWAPMAWVYTQLNDTNPIWDAIVLIIGATASLLVFKGYGDSYSLWLMSDAVTIILWFTAFMDGYSASALPMLLTMLFYLMTALYGRFFAVWSKRKI